MVAAARSYGDHDAVSAVHGEAAGIDPCSARIVFDLDRGCSRKAEPNIISLNVFMIWVLVIEYPGLCFPWNRGFERSCRTEQSGQISRTVLFSQRIELAVEVSEADTVQVILPHPYAVGRVIDKEVPMSALVRHADVVSVADGSGGGVGVSHTSQSLTHDCRESSLPGAYVRPAFVEERLAYKAQALL